MNYSASSVAKKKKKFYLLKTLPLFMAPKFYYRFRKNFVGSRPDEVNEFFNLSDPFSRTRPWGLFSL
jgi:hypothetical protein